MLVTNAGADYVRYLVEDLLASVTVYVEVVGYVRCWRR